MATEKYSAATDRGNLLTTELNGLTTGSTSAVGTALDNATNKDRWAIAILSVTFGTNPTALSVCELYATVAADGTNYEQTTPPPETSRVGTFQLKATTGAQLIASNPFRLRGPFPTKFQLVNRSGQSFPGSGSTVNVRTYNRDIN